jgi:aldehyde dehydrogenase (NAD+)
MLAYLRPAGAARPLRPVAAVAPPAAAEVPPIDRTAKLFIGGRQARPDGGHSRAVWSPRGRLLGHAGLGNRKDIRNAVEAAQAARGWARTTAWNRAQVLYYLAENLSARAAEFAARIADLTGQSGAAEVETAIDRLFACAAWADKWDGAARAVPIRGVALAMNEPAGVIGIVAPDEAPLLGLVSLLGPAIALGNTVVAVPSEAFPLAATDLCQVIETSDVPAGVVNIVTGRHAELADTLARHLDVDAVWCFSSQPLSGTVERLAAGNLKRTWVNHGRATDWGAFDLTRALREASEVKTVWVPWGE